MDSGGFPDKTAKKNCVFVRDLGLGLLLEKSGHQLAGSLRIFFKNYRHEAHKLTLLIELSDRNLYVFIPELV